MVIGDGMGTFMAVSQDHTYRKWIHKHLFVETSEGTRIHDAVTYQLPFYPIGELAAPIVHLQVRRIFAYRATALQRAFGC